MKSTFRLPWPAGMAFAESLAAHCIQAMQFLQYFVPAVFASEYHRPTATLHVEHRPCALGVAGGIAELALARGAVERALTQ